MEEPVSLSESGHVDKQTELLVLTVDIGDGRQDTIPIHEDDDPAVVAYEFAIKHGLDSSLQENLAALIMQNKEMVQMHANSPEGFKWTKPSSSFSEPPINPTETSPKEPMPKQRSVFDRLYAHNTKKPRNSNPQPTEKAKHTSNINYGEWLYIKGLKKIDAQSTSTKRDEENFSFKPQIDKYSNMLSPRYFERTEDLLIRKSVAYKENLEAKKAQAVAEEMKECSFQPKIHSKSSKQITTTCKHLELYSQAEKHRERREKMSENLSYTFRPDKITRRKMNASKDNGIAERLNNWKKEFESRMDKIRDLEHTETPHRPQIGRDPLKHKEEGQSIHEYLYAKKINSKKNTLKQHPQHTMSANSLKIYQETRGKQYAKLFNKMDSDQDGVISAQFIDLDRLDDKSLDIFTPLFGLLDEGIQMNLNQFVSFMEEIWGSLDQEARGHIMRKEKPNQRTEHNPQTKLTPRSKDHTSKKLLVFSPDLYERQKQCQLLTELKNTKIREIQEESLLKECSFKPNIKKHRKR